jgi:hypothetical protein
MLLRCRISLLPFFLLAAFAAGASSAAAQHPGDGNQGLASADLAEVHQYRLTMDKVQQFVATTVAIQKLRESNPDLKKQMDAEKSDNETISQQAADLEQHFPQVAALVRSQGTTPREYIVIFAALITDVSLVAMKRQGEIKDYPPNSITPENAAFIEQNYDKLTQVLTALNAGTEGQK